MIYHYYFRRVKYLTAHRVGWSLLTKKFNLCTPFDGTVLTDVINLFESLIGNFEGIVQYNKDNRKDQKKKQYYLNFFSHFFNVN